MKTTICIFLLICMITPSRTIAIHQVNDGPKIEVRTKPKERKKAKKERTEVEVMLRKAKRVLRFGIVGMLLFPFAIPALVWSKKIWQWLRINENNEEIRSKIKTKNRSGMIFSIIGLGLLVAAPLLGGLAVLVLYGFLDLFS